MKPIPVNVRRQLNDPRVPVFARPLTIAGLSEPSTVLVHALVLERNTRTLAERVCLFLDRRSA
jgi:hypothetical protein